MDIKERVETTRFVSATVSVDDLKQVAIGAVKREAKIVDDSLVVASEADLDPAIGITVTIAVKQVLAPGPDASSAPAADVDVPAAPVADVPAAAPIAPVIPTLSVIG